VGWNGCSGLLQPLAHLEPHAVVPERPHEHPGCHRGPADDLQRPSAGFQNTPEPADLRVAELPPGMIHYGH
jgi:hypothetical protein